MKSLFLLLLAASPLFAVPPAPVTALAYHPNGKFLLAGLHGEVRVFLDGDNQAASRLDGFTQRVTALRFSKDGKLLAVASGEPGKSGPVQLFGMDDKTGMLTAKATFTGHRDIVYALDFSPDGKQLASAGYDRSIMLWNTVGASTKEPVQQLKDHSDTVYGLAWHPAGKLLASAGADRAVKVWDVTAGKRLYTLGDPTDWVYAVTWHPEGKLLAAAGADKSIRIWQADAEGGKLVSSVFAHTAPVTKLIYGADGKTLYSMSEGKNLKRWDTAKMVEQFVFPPQPETMLSLAVRPDGQRVAVGRFDGVLQLLEPAKGQLVSQLLPEKPKAPMVGSITPDHARRGQTVKLTIDGTDLSDDSAIDAGVPGVTIKILPGGSDKQRTVELTLPATIPAGLVPLTVKNPAGSFTAMRFFADRFEVALDSTGNDSARRGHTVTLPATLVGQLTRAGEADYYRFTAKANQEIGVQVIVSIAGSKMEPVVELTDASGAVIAEGTTLLGYKIPADGTYAIGIRDKEFRGGSEFSYRLHIGGVSVVTRVLPMGVSAGKQSKLQLVGVNLPSRETTVDVPAMAVPGSKIPVPMAGMTEQPLGEMSVIVGEFAEITSGHVIPVPGTANGVISQSGKTDTWTFAAKKGQPLILEVNARRIGSGLDSYLEILDDKDQPRGRATLRCVARTFVAFRDHDSNQSNIRLETWNELAMGDYVYVGTELLRIFNLPPNPDADCSFYAVNGQRAGQLDTTTGHHPMGAPVYKVEIHPPGTSFPPNGMPVFRLAYRNDDGGALYGKDSHITFDPPADGEYRVRIGDSRGMGRADFGYRLTVRPPKPDFAVSFTPTAPAVWKGGSIPVSAAITRLDGFAGPVQLKLENLPEGFDAPVTQIEAGQASASFALYAAPTAGNTEPKKHPPLKLTATAIIDGKPVIHEANGGMPALLEPGDIVTTTMTDSVTVKPGGETRLTVKIERRNGFTGRIPLEVRGLPYGVRVLDIGLNGILVTEKDTQRDVVIYAEPWVTPKQLPFVVLAKREGKGTEHGAKSVLLKVEK
ncbi:WD40 repeat domain-containing protein [Zavarzinella formosa]|uniref:WD40 repeat domain-containing protein n=1 Tax=Zavarzinella formosa TaxID=360055 RepID=UPI00035C40B5|nr:WD40 repeat domain-containing protein [Zavarzinella formosa]